jgi:hypothetical protein
VLCNTWFPLCITPVLGDDNAVSGSRELERVIFCLKGSLTHLHLGDYIWDDILIYIAEMCKELEVVQLYSKKITDGSISHLLKRAEHLSALDVSGCSEFNGLAFTEVDTDTFKATKLKWCQLNLTGHEMAMARERLQVLVPNCQIILDTKRNFVI